MDPGDVLMWRIVSQNLEGKALAWWDIIVEEADM